MDLHLYPFPLKANIPIETSLQPHLSLLHASAHHWIGARFAMIRNDVLPEWFADDDWNGASLREFWPFVMHEVRDEAVLYLGIVLCRFEASGNIIGKFYRKGIDVFPSSQVRVLKLVQQVLHGVEVLAARVLHPVLGAAFEPLAPFLP